MTNKLEISRELAKEPISYDDGVRLRAGHSLRTLLVAPVVERQPVAVVMATGGPHDKEDRVLCELQAELPPVGTKLYAEQPAPVAVVLPDLLPRNPGYWPDLDLLDKIDDAEAKGFNRAIAKVKELNQ